MNYQLHYSRTHFINYLAGVFDEGFILHLADENKAHSVLLTPKNPMKPDNLYVLILDCSGSMATHFSQYMSHVKHFIGNILDKASPNDILRIVGFNTTTKISEFRLHDKEIENNIEKYFSQLTANSSTRLHGTVCDELKNIFQYPERDIAVVIFTDGCDNQSSHLEKRTLTHQQQQLKSSISPPQIFTLGLGENYSHDLMLDLASQTGAQHLKLETIDDFHLINEHLTKMQISRTL